MQSVNFYEIPPEFGDGMVELCETCADKRNAAYMEASDEYAICMVCGYCAALVDERADAYYGDDLPSCG